VRFGTEGSEVQILHAEHTLPGDVRCHECGEEADT
jgi:hypothetical protein